MNESDYTRKLCKLWASKGMYVIVIAGGMHQQPGLPDRIFCWRGKTVFIEFKGPETPIQTNQKLTIQAIRARRCVAHVVRHLGNGKHDIDDQGFSLTSDELVAVLFGE